MRTFYYREWTSCEKKLVTATAFLLGVVLGFMFAPVKKGIYCGNNNGRTVIVPEEQD